MLAGSMLTLSACGGGGGSDPVYIPPSAPTLSGTAAVGQAIDGGRVTAKCADGNTFTQTVTTDANGNWSGTLASASMPCALQVTGGTPPDTLYSYATSTGTINITPLTDLALVQATGILPATWFASFDGSTPLDPTVLSNAMDDVTEALQTAGFDVPTSGNPFTTPFAADGTGWDGLLDDLRDAIDEDTTLADYNAFLDDVLANGLDNSIPNPPAPETFSISGTISGATDGVNVIWELLVDEAIVRDYGNSNGPVTFTSVDGLAEGSDWSVVINSAPAGQTCSVSNGSGVLTADVTNVSITCSDIVVAPTGFSIEGDISGASGNVSWQTLVGGVFYHDGANGNGSVTFTYGDGITDGSIWSVEVLTPPAGQTCNVADGSGTIAGNITNVAITCSDIVVTPTTYSIDGTLSGASGTVQWETLVDDEAFFSGSSTNGAITFTPAQGMDSGSNWSVVVTVPPAGQTCNVGNGSGTLNSDIVNVSITCQDEGVDPDPGTTPIYDFSALNLQPSVPVDMVPTPPAGEPTNPSAQIQSLFQQLGDAERAKIFAPAPGNLQRQVNNNIFAAAHYYEVTEFTPDQSWVRVTDMDFGSDNEANTSDDFIKGYTVYPNGQTGVSYSFNHPGADNMWFSEDDVAGERNLGDVVYFPDGVLLEYEGASEDAVLIIPCLEVGADGAPFTADDQPGCSLGYQIAVIDGQGNRGQVITYNNAGTDGLWFTADDRVKNYTLLTYNGTGVGIATVVYNGDGADNIWFNSDDDVQLHTLTKLGDDFKPRYTATYNGRGTDNIWFSADDVVQAWTYYGYDANGNNILVATHTNKGGDATWFTADDSATAIISLKDENGYPIINGNISSGGMGPDGIWLSGDEVLQYSYYYLSEYNAAGLQTHSANITGKGADNKWFTADDVPSTSNYWVKEYDGANKLLKWLYMDASLAPAAPAFSDSHINRYRAYNEAGSYVDLTLASGHFGADNMPFTEDDIIPWPYSVTMASGIDQFNQPGPDGQWFTADDVRSGYTVYSYDGTRRTQQQFNAADEMISYTEIADATASEYRLNRYTCSAPAVCPLTGYSIIQEDINGNPLWTFHYTAEDVVSHVEYSERDANGNVLLGNTYSTNSGPDGTFGTFDDFTYFSWYTYNSNGDVVATGMERIGDDGEWYTDDDTRSIDYLYLPEYGPDDLALNVGNAGDTCSTLPASLGASGDINLLVRDQNGAPLSGVIAQLGANGSTVTTDANGEASFVGLSGTQDVHLFKDGFAWESFYCVAPGLDVTLKSKLASLTQAKQESVVKFQIDPTSAYVSLRLLDAQGRSLASRTYASGNGSEAGTWYNDLYFDLPAGSEVSGELWVLESDTYGRLLSAQSLGQQTYTTVATNDYHAVREQISVSLPANDPVVVAFDGTAVFAGSGSGTGFYVSLGGLYKLPFNYEPSVGLYGDVAALAPGRDVTLPTLMQPTGVGAGTSNWSAWYPGVYPQIGAGTFVASIITGFQYPAVVTTQQDSSATPTISWIPATQKENAPFLSANTVELHSAAGGIGYQSHWTIHTPPGETQVTLPSLPVGISGPALPNSSYSFVIKARAVPALDYHELIGTQDLHDLDPALATELLVTGQSIDGVKLHREL